MGFIVDALAIALGGILGGIFNKRINMRSNAALAIGIMLISLVGLLENILSITDEGIVGEHTIVVTIALVVGSTIGDALKLEDKLFSLSQTSSLEKNGLIDSILFFGIGGLQISGPILYALTGDSFQLILKGVIDFPFALMLGATYGKKTALAAPVVALGQVLVALLSWSFGAHISDALLCQLCSLGYLILFFSGFNMICPPLHKIKNINMLPGILLIILYNVLTEVAFS